MKTGQVAAQRRAERHHANKRQRHGPKRASAALRGPEADGDHRAKMIQAGERVQQAIGKAVNRADAGMRVRERGSEEHCSDDE